VRIVMQRSGLAAAWRIENQWSSQGHKEWLPIATRYGKCSRDTAEKSGTNNLTKAYYQTVNSKPFYNMPPSSSGPGSWFFRPFASVRIRLGVL
jgi:hypothetical protein